MLECLKAAGNIVFRIPYSDFVGRQIFQLNSVSQGFQVKFGLSIQSRERETGQIGILSETFGHLMIHFPIIVLASASLSTSLPNRGQITGRSSGY